MSEIVPRDLHCGRCDEPIALDEPAVWDHGIDWYVHAECKYGGLGPDPDTREDET